MSRRAVVTKAESVWCDVCAVEDIPLRGARRLPSASGDVAVFRTGDGEVFALFDRCPHKGGPLSQGLIHGRAVTCPLHGRVVDLASGELTGADAAIQDRLARHRGVIETLARLSSCAPAGAIPKGSALFVLGEAVVALPLGDVIDFARERARLEKDLKKAQDEIARFDAKLGNEQFVAKAPEEVLEEQRSKRAEAAALAARLEEAIKRLA